MTLTTHNGKHWNETRTRNGVSFPWTQTPGGYLPMPFFWTEKAQETSMDMTYSWRTFMNWQVTEAEVTLILFLTVSSSGGEITVAVIANFLMWGSDFPISHVQSRIFRGQTWSEVTVTALEVTMTALPCLQRRQISWSSTVKQLQPSSKTYTLFFCWSSQFYLANINLK